MDEYIEEIGKAFEVEADYLREAEHQEIFGQFVASIEGVVVPSPVRELCRSDLLVMDRLEGLLLKDAWATLDQDQRNAVGAQFVDFFAQTFHYHHWVYGDPPEICTSTAASSVLDFGCARTVELDAPIATCSSAAMWANDGEWLTQLYVD